MQTLLQWNRNTCVFVALSINHSKRMRCITLSSAAWLYHIFRHYLINGTIFGKKFMNMCFDFLYTLYETFPILWRIQRDIIIYIGLHVSTCYYSHILMKLDFSRHIFEKYSNIKRHVNPSCGAELFHAGGRTDWQTDKQDMTKLTIAFCNFANEPNNALILPLWIRMCN
jgi:hypothetical protein